MTTYLDDVILPYYMAQLNVLDNFILYDLEFKVLLVSPNTLMRLGFSTQEDIYLKTLKELEFIKPRMMDKLVQIFNSVVSNKKMTKFIGIGGQIKPLYKNHYEIILQSYTPILDPQNEVVAVIASKLPVIDRNLINLFFPCFKSDVTNNHLVTESLTPREFEILYLLSSGFSQYEIAKIIKVSRGTVLKTLTDRILPKLGIDQNDTSAIVRKAKELGIYSKIPRSLVDEQIVIIN